MTLGQKGAMANLAFGYHLNANSNDFAGGLVQDGVDTNITYDAANGILGPAASFNGSSSKIYLGSSDITTPVTNGSFSIICLFRVPASFSVFPIISRGLVQASGSTFYGMDISINASTGIAFSRWIGNTTVYNSTSGNYTFNSGTTYLIAITYNRTTGANVFYIYPLRPGGASLIANGATQSKLIDIAFHASYDEGYHFGARLRAISPIWGKGFLGEVLIFDDIRTANWIRSYALQLKGMLDLE